MWFHSLLASWKSARPRRQRPQPARRGARLVLERLEDRTLLSSYTAYTASDLIADINAANAAGGLNTIQLSAPTTAPYVLTSVNNTTNGATGLPVIAANDNLTIVGNGDTIERGTAAGTPAFRLLAVASGDSLTLGNLTLQGGEAFGAGVAAEGGAIYSQGNLVLNGVTVQNNQALGNAGLSSTRIAPGGNASGGGLYITGGTAALTNVTLSSNTADGGQGGTNSSATGGFGYVGGNGYGGGLAVAGGTVSLTSTAISSNTAQGGNGGNGSNGRGGAGGEGIGGGLFVAGGAPHGQRA
jgi:hypothetical protein